MNATLGDIRRFLRAFHILQLDEPVVRIFAQRRADLRTRGTLIPDLDLLIAATALSYDLELLTRNVRHFERIEGLRIFQPA